MSYILEALKKNEQERDLGRVPGIDALPYETLEKAPRRPYLLWGVLALLAINLGVAGVYLWQRAATREKMPDVAVKGPTEAPVGRPVAAAGGLIKPSAVTVKPLPEPAPAPAPGPARTVQRTVPVSKVTARPPSPAPEPVEPVAVVAATVPVPAAGVPPLLEELDPAQRQALPALSLDVHVYANQPQRRFVLINLRKLREGDSLENTLVEAITPEGVVLSHQGLRFRLQRR